MIFKDSEHLYEEFKNNYRHLDKPPLTQKEVEKIFSKNKYRYGVNIRAISELWSIIDNEVLSVLEKKGQTKE